MHEGTGIALIVAAVALLLLTALVLRRRLPRLLTDALCGAGGAAIGIGGLLLLRGHVSTSSWVVAPVVLALLAVWHLRVLFGGSGPFRT